LLTTAAAGEDILFTMPDAQTWDAARLALSAGIDAVEICGVRSTLSGNKSDLSQLSTQNVTNHGGQMPDKKQDLIDQTSTTTESIVAGS
jgi:hypothetical protein